MGVEFQIVNFLSTERDRLLADALTRVPAGARGRALEIGATPSPALACCFQTLETSPLDLLADLPNGEFNFVAAIHVPGEIPIFILRQSARLLCHRGVLCARLTSAFSRGELAEMARDLDFQVCAMELGETLSLTWRKRANGWRADLAEHAALASARVTRVSNGWDDCPVVPNRGRYARLSILVSGLPMDLDLLDLEIIIGDVRATAVSLAEPDAGGQQRIMAELPGLEQTGLVPVQLRWLGERLTMEPAYVRVIPAGPIVPRIVSVISGSTREAGLTISVEDLVRPDELTVSLDGVALWGLETRCTDSKHQKYSVRLPLPDDVKAGVHEIQLMSGRRKLTPISIEID